MGLEIANLQPEFLSFAIEFQQKYLEVLLKVSNFFGLFSVRKLAICRTTVTVVTSKQKLVD